MKSTPRDRLLSFNRGFSSCFFRGRVISNIYQVDNARSSLVKIHLRGSRMHTSITVSRCQILTAVRRVVSLPDLIAPGHRISPSTSPPPPFVAVFLRCGTRNTVAYTDDANRLIDLDGAPTPFVHGPLC